MGKKGGGKGDKGAGKGAKGGPKGGKGPPADPLMECAADDDWVDELAGDPVGAEWLFDDAIASLAPWVQAPAKRGRRGARVWRPFGTDDAGLHDCAPSGQTKILDSSDGSFAILP